MPLKIYNTLARILFNFLVNPSFAAIIEMFGGKFTSEEYKMNSKTDQLRPKLFTVLKDYSMAQFGKDV
ncbi:MAG: hypothetical protein K6E64_09685, partial [Lachnospiraceae bacterium]|nr:hypothetical protein [Lachnospiraceae bacterium]